MAQYQVAKFIFESEGASFKKIQRHAGIVESSCRTSLIKLEKKGLIERYDDTYYPHPEASEEDLERIRPRTINELKEK